MHLKQARNSIMLPTQPYKFMSVKVILSLTNIITWTSLTLMYALVLGQNTISSLEKHIR